MSEASTFKYFNFIIFHKNVLASDNIVYHFLYSLTHHVRAHLAGFHCDSDSVPPYYGLDNHTTMQGVAELHAFHRRSLFVRVEVIFTAR